MTAQELINAALVEILMQVARRHRLHPNLVTGQTRRHSHVLARNEVAWRARHELKITLPRIAAFLGGRHHTKIMHAIDQHQRAVEQQPLIGAA